MFFNNKDPVILLERSDEESGRAQLKRMHHALKSHFKKITESSSAQALPRFARPG